MSEAPDVVDLTQEPDRLVALAAHAAVRERLQPGGALRLRTRDDPELLLRGLNVQMRDALAWRASSRGAYWEALVRLAADEPARDALELLQRDHRRLDELLGRALRLLNQADADAARGLLGRFAPEIRRHMRAEDELLAPQLGASPALEAMLGEHRELREQLAAVEQGCAAGEEAHELEPFVALLSGTLAKHEHREETELFPGWRAQMSALGPGGREALLRQVRAMLAQDESQAIG
jgi:hypothetical protein